MDNENNSPFTHNHWKIINDQTSTTEPQYTEKECTTVNQIVEVNHYGYDVDSYQPILVTTDDWRPTLYFTLEDNHAAVIKPPKDAPLYEGIITVPAIISYNGNQYKVTHIADGAFCAYDIPDDAYLAYVIFNIPKFLACPTCIQLPDTITHIGAYAFAICQELEKINIPASVQYIGEHFLSSSSPVVENHSSCIYVDPHQAIYSADLTHLIHLPSTFFDDEYRIHPKTTHIDECACYNCPGLRSVIFPPTLTYIGANAFYNCNMISKIEMPNTVTDLGVGAFQYCWALKDVVLSNQLTTIPFYAFSGCLHLKTIELPDTITDIEDKAFLADEKLKKINVPQSLEYVAPNAFKFTKIKTKEFEPYMNGPIED